MSRFARLVIPGCPHHIIQRGNRRQKVFFSDEDRAFFLILPGRAAHRSGISLWAYCLMDNHVHLIAVPKSKDSFSSGLGSSLRKFSLVINTRENWKGFLWQGRYISYPLDERHCYEAVRYVERNPVRAGLVLRAELYPWSSARFHVLGESHPLLSPFPLQKSISNWSTYLGQGETPEQIDEFLRHELTGRPLGSDEFVKSLEKLTGRILAPRQKGRPRKNGERISRHPF